MATLNQIKQLAELGMLLPIGGGDGSGGGANIQKIDTDENGRLVVTMTDGSTVTSPNAVSLSDSEIEAKIAELLEDYGEEITDEQVTSLWD